IRGCIRWQLAELFGLCMQLLTSQQAQLGCHILGKSAAQSIAGNYKGVWSQHLK
ncbi:unnamed protein product, partial [marine sediment metagenome]